MSFAQCSWINAPTDWSLHDETLRVVTDEKSDFWRETYYGFTHDTGHFFACRINKEFTAELRVQAKYRELYDQAGLMVRVSEAVWLKAGIEFSDGVPMLSSVLTVNRSDWASSPYAEDPCDFRIRITVAAEALRLQVSADGMRWPLVRLCPFPAADGYLVGPMCCSPTRAGLAVRFSEFRLGEASTRDLHDLS